MLTKSSRNTYTQSKGYRIRNDQLGINIHEDYKYCQMIIPHNIKDRDLMEGKTLCTTISEYSSGT